MKLSLFESYTALVEKKLQEAMVDVSQLQPGTKVKIERGMMPGFSVYIIGPQSQELAQINAEEPRGQNCGNAFIISMTAAVQGYGPLAYDIAMEYAGNRGVTADRDSVSKDASKVWEYYFSKRADVKKKELNPRDCSFDSSKSQGSISSQDAGEQIVRPWLNYIYYATGKNKLSALQKNNMLEIDF